MDIKKEREAFEAYMSEKYKNLMDRRQCLNNGGGYMAWDMNVAWRVWQAAKAQEAEKLKGCVVVPVELSETVAEKLALGKVEKPRQENDVVWQEIADKAYSENLKIKKLEIKRDYKELVEAARGGNE
ncbi:hypothetical protein HMPREF0026_01357 [Acinetobacter junii SH205]|uniref:Uncharacterized protein n=1 Tax=Acinetobacter junii SH205 TaxID=575587 RepID=D0SJQ9_ACIJU|nr:hypothetical protein [Acinetobacter junii]EEY94081.1 hypothetical protein HMPREF0026_01357 [Acinetobacter junii SH205]